MDLSRRLLLLLGAQTRARVLPTLLIAGLVTAAIAVPLALRALDAEQPAAESDLLVANDNPLDGSVVSGDVAVAFTADSAEAVSFNLFEAGGSEPIFASQDLEGPSFDLVVNDDGSTGSLDSTLLSNGSYELFITVAAGDDENRTAVRFEVQNP